MTSAEQPVSYRPGTPDDAVGCHDLMWASVTGFARSIERSGRRAGAGY